MKQQTKKDKTTMQAIITKFMPATTYKGVRIRATAERGSITIPYPDGSCEEAHIKAADALCSKFAAEDIERYGKHTNPWMNNRASGGIYQGGYAHVFIGGAK